MDRKKKKKNMAAGAEPRAGERTRKGTWDPGGETGFPPKWALNRPWQGQRVHAGVPPTGARGCLNTICVFAYLGCSAK